MKLHVTINNVEYTLRISPNHGDKFTRKDMNNLEKWKAHLNKQPDVSKVDIDDS